MQFGNIVGKGGWKKGRHIKLDKEEGRERRTYVIANYRKIKLLFT